MRKKQNYEMTEKWTNWKGISIIVILWLLFFSLILQPLLLLLPMHQFLFFSSFSAIFHWLKWKICIWSERTRKKSHTNAWSTNNVINLSELFNFRMKFGRFYHWRREMFCVFNNGTNCWSISSIFCTFCTRRFAPVKLGRLCVGVIRP